MTRSRHDFQVMPSHWIASEYFLSPRINRDQSRCDRQNVRPQGRADSDNAVPEQKTSGSRIMAMIPWSLSLSPLTDSSMSGHDPTHHQLCITSSQLGPECAQMAPVIAHLCVQVNHRNRNLFEFLPNRPNYSLCKRRSQLKQSKLRVIIVELITWPGSSFQSQTQNHLTRQSSSLCLEPFSIKRPDQTRYWALASDTRAHPEEDIISTQFSRPRHRLLLTSAICSILCYLRTS